MKIKSQKDFWSGLMFVVVGIAFAWGATEYSFGSSARPGPGYFPFGLGVIMAALGGIITFKALVIEVEGGDPIGPWPLKQLFIILGAVVLFGFAVPKLGLIVTLPLLIIVSSFASGEFRWLEVVINSVVLTLLSWGVFLKGLSLTIPMWPTFLG
ncbi:MAG: tripartite tricarboxylate transporter TctB family protein [Rubrivivax sp.]